MFGRVTFYPTLLYNVFMSKVSKRNWFDRIDDNCLLGALPFRNLSAQVFSCHCLSHNYVINQLIEKERVGGVVSMNEDFELKFWVTTKDEWQRMGIKFLQLNTADILHAPTQDKLRTGVKFIQQFNGTDSSVYVHCKAGRTRSATLVACYLMKKHEWEPKDAVNYIKSKRDHILLRSTQWEAINLFYAENVEKRPRLKQNMNISSG